MARQPGLQPAYRSMCGESLKNDLLWPTGIKMERASIDHREVTYGNNGSDQSEY